MSKHWRPDGWDEERRKYIDDVHNNNYWGLEAVWVSEGFEVGASVMLDVLRKIGWGSGLDKDGAICTHVSIPDDPKEGTLKRCFPFDDNRYKRKYINRGYSLESANSPDITYKEWWSKFNHKATKVVESGVFCSYCGEQTDADTFNCRLVIDFVRHLPVPGSKSHYCRNDRGIK